MASTITNTTYIRTSNQLSTEILLEDNYSHNWHGQIVDNNKPWSVEPHRTRPCVHEGESSSAGALTFRVKNHSHGSWCWLFAWENTYDSDDKTSDLKVYTRIAELDTAFNWAKIKEKLSSDNINEPVCAQGFQANVNFVQNEGSDTKATLTATISLSSINNQ